MNNFNRNMRWGSSMSETCACLEG